MKTSDLRITIENPRGSYKKFKAGYPVSGVTFPTHYGYIQNYASEDNRDLDVFLGNGDLFGFIVMYRPSCPDNKETKTFIQISEKELNAIKKAYEPVIEEVTLVDQETFLKEIQKFNRHAQKLPFVNLLSNNHVELIEFYTNVVGLTPVNPDEDPKKEKWYGFNTGAATFAIEPMSNRDKYNFSYNKENPVLIQLKAKGVDHLTEWTERLEKTNVTIGQRIMEKSYGTVTTFVDPDGNLIELLVKSKK